VAALHLETDRNGAEIQLLVSAVTETGFGYGVSTETTQKYGFGLVSVTAKKNGRITVSAET